MRCVGLTPSISRRESLLALAGVAMLLAVLPWAFGMRAAGFAPFAEPATWRFFGSGMLLTLEVALVAIAISLPLATVAALARQDGAPWVHGPVTALIELIRALPILLVIYVVFRLLASSGLPMARLDVTWLQIRAQAFIPVVIALALYTTAVNAETLRAAIAALDRGQTEAASALGLSYAQRVRYVILPQAYRRALPPLVAQLATLVKDTSLGYIVALQELTWRGTILYQGRFNPLETLYVLAILYFLVNYLLARVAAWLERRLGGSSNA
jgi:His/Glu/Gln/Arg/opine family amino acid ABC transporter permease subunit